MAGSSSSNLTGVLSRVIAWTNILVYMEGLLLLLVGSAIYLFKPEILLQEITSFPAFEDFTYDTLKTIIMNGTLYCILNAAMGFVLLRGVKSRNVRFLSVWVVYSILCWFIKFMILFIKSKDISLPLWFWVIIGVSTIFDWICITVVQSYATKVREYHDLDGSWDYGSDTASKASVVIY